MSKHLKKELRWLNDAALCEMGGTYDGTIADVVEERVKNRFKRNADGKPIECVEPVIVFADGVRWIPNFGARRTLIDELGAETDGWRGRRLIVSRARIKDTAKWQKVVTVHARDVDEAPAWVTTADESDIDDAIATRDDEDDVQIGRFARRRG